MRNRDDKEGGTIMSSDVDVEFDEDSIVETNEEYLKRVDPTRSIEILRDEELVHVEIESDGEKIFGTLQEYKLTTSGDLATKISMFPTDALQAVKFISSLKENAKPINVGFKKNADDDKYHVVEFSEINSIDFQLKKDEQNKFLFVIYIYY